MRGKKSCTSAGSGGVAAGEGVTVAWICTASGAYFVRACNLLTCNIPAINVVIVNINVIARRIALDENDMESITNGAYGLDER